MGILPILTILYGLFAMGMATDMMADVPDSPSTSELSQEKDATFADALTKSEDVVDADSPEEKQDDEYYGGDEATQADSPVPLDFDLEVTEDTPVTSGFDLEVTEDLAEDDTQEGDESQEEALESDEDGADGEDSPTDSLVTSGFDLEVTEDLAEDDTQEGNEPQEEALESDEDGADGEDSPADSLAASKAPIVKRVVGGRISGMNAWPWQISLQYWTGRKYFHTCGGVLIKRNWVLTAAHCVDTRGRKYRVVAGEHNLSIRNCREQYLSIRSIHIHPRWNKNSVISGNDIALLRLSTYATLNSYVKLATLPPANRVTSGTCTVIGWGRTSPRGRGSNVLRQANLRIVSYSTCRLQSWWGCSVTRAMVCAGGDGRRSSCQGDSGGALNCYRNRRWEVHGLSSFSSSRGCNTVRKPNVFTRVSSYRYWISRVAR